MYQNATRLAIKFGEHTWGLGNGNHFYTTQNVIIILDVKSYLFDNSNYSNAYFEMARTSGPYAAEYQTLEQEWWSQRNLGINIPIATLQAAGHPLFDVI